MSETTPKIDEMAPQTSETAPPTDPKRKRPTGKIAILASICVVVLGISIWGLVATQVPGNAAEMTNQQLGSDIAADRDNNSSSQANNADAREEKPQGESTSPAASNSENAASVVEGATGGTPGAGSNQGAGTGSNQGADGGSSQSTATGSSQGAGTGSSQSAGGDTGQSSAQPQPQPQPQQPQPINVSLSVSCNVAIEAGSATAQAVSDNGAMRYATLRLDAGTSVYDALVASGARLGSQGSPGSPIGVYISAIDGLPQGEAGPQSGWKYYVNGTAPGVSCDKYVLSNGDSVEWRYVTNA